jgi:hypothetical protein
MAVSVLDVLECECPAGGTKLAVNSTPKLRNQLLSGSNIHT